MHKTINFKSWRRCKRRNSQTRQDKDGKFLCSMRSFPRGLWLSLKTISVRNKCVYEETVDNSSMKCPVDGQTFKDSHA